MYILIGIKYTLGVSYEYNELDVFLVESFRSNGK